jgi:deazaflavin-dependent oxidoreductase (nitroreductase family)
MRPHRKRALARRFEKYFVNPQLRFAVRHGIAPGNFALLETTGRRSGRPRCTPVGNGLSGDTFWLVAEHGEHCQYVKNLLADPNVRVKAGREWRTGVASPLPDDDGLGRRRRLDQRHGLGGRIDGAIFRAVATQPLTIRIDLDGSRVQG